MNDPGFKITGNYVDIFNRKIFPAILMIRDAKVAGIKELSSVEDPSQPYIMPGFIDSHVHVESSMLIPSEFARLAVVHGTIGSVSDPHEIANVAGLAGVDFMIENGKTVPFRFCWGAPSCVPATEFETAGASLNSDEVESLLQRPDIHYLSEMMNFPGVLQKDREVIQKLSSAIDVSKPIDGHAPGLRGTDAERYIRAGISTDHECYTLEEALEKLQLGMKIIIREGSAARNFDALAPLLHQYSDEMMFGSDDKHPDSLVKGHINNLCARAVGAGIDVFKVLKAACINPVLHYRIKAGLLRVGDPADLILVDNLTNFGIRECYIKGLLVAKNGKTCINPARLSGKKYINHFKADRLSPQQLKIDVNEIPLENGFIPSIGVIDGQLITSSLLEKPVLDNNCYEADPENDLLKIVVVNRYHAAPISKGFIRNTGIKNAAIASSVAHDSHNIVAIGSDDHLLCDSINLIIENKGGISCVTEKTSGFLGLPVAGLMSPEDGYEVAETYTKLDLLAKSTGCNLQAPFMTLSFMALLVIPELKMSDLGLFDGEAFRFKYFASQATTQ